MAVTMSAEQFQELMQGMQQAFRSQIGDTRSNTPTSTISTSAGNFSRCTTRFGGVGGERVDTFIDAISVYKDCVEITDENALKGLPMLLTGLAAEWWSGVKSAVTTFPDAMRDLRNAFGANKPAHQVYRELFAKEQDEATTTDIFVCKARALLAQLPEPKLVESVQLDMVYGLLHRGIRKRVRREELLSFDDLLRLARTAEESFREKRRKGANSETSSGKATTSSKPATTEKRKERPRCTFCSNFGHEKADCRKLASQSASVPAPFTTTTSRPAISCYGCGAPGVIRSQCAACKGKLAPTTATSTVSFNSLETEVPRLNPRARPILQIQVHGVTGTGYADTAAQQSVASHSLYQVLLNAGQVFEKTALLATLADGKPRAGEALLTTTDVTLQGRTVRTTFIVLPEARDNRTLLGIDFMTDAGVNLNVTNQTWCFADDPQSVHQLHTEPAPRPVGACLNYVQSLRTEEGEALEPAQRQRLAGVIQANEDVFAQGGEPTPYAEHRIDTGDHPPISVPPYRLPVRKKEVLRDEVEKMLADMVIEECESPWAAPVVLVPKKDGSTRVCIDYRRLNAVSVSDSYPLPRIDDLLHTARRSWYMSTIDLKSGYYQVAVRPADRDKTAFITPFGTFRFLRMPMGLKNSGATFQRLMDRFRSGLRDVRVLVYLDDLIVLSETFDEHLDNLQAVFHRLRQFSLRANREKCVFARSEVKFLGHVITPRGIETDPGKISAIADMPSPRNLKHVRTFLQTCSWYRRFVPDFSQIAKPLSDLTKKNVTWRWAEPEQQAFVKLKAALTTAPVLRQADEQLPFVVRTDASNYALGAVLLQGEGADERPVEYASRLLSPAERNYHTSEREALAVVFAVKKFRGYIEGSHVVVETDHQALKWLMTHRSPSGRLARWALTLQQYDIEVRYTPGKCNVVADTLSRPTCAENDQDACGVCSFVVEVPKRGARSIREGQLDDPEVKKIVAAFEEPDHPDVANWVARGYLMLDGVLYRHGPEHEGEEAQLVVPQSERLSIMQQHHDAPTAGHYGAEKTYHRISTRYYWSGMRRFITDYVKNCVECQRYKPANTKPAGLLRTPVAAQRFETVAIDLFGPLPETTTGHKWVFITEDVATRWVELFPMVHATAEACARLLIEEVFLRYGTARRVISDNGVQFVSAVMQHAMHCLGVTQMLTPYYHPEANPVERKNRDLKAQLAILVQGNHASWMEKLPAIRFAMNTATCQSTGHSAAYLTFGRDLRTVDDVERDLRAVVVTENFVPQATPYLLLIADTLRETRDVQERNQDRRKAYADSKRREAPEYAIGDLVLVQTHVLSNATKGVSSKFAPKRDGPYRILREVGVVYDVALLDAPELSVGRYHVSALTPFVGSIDEAPIPTRPLRRRGRPRKK